MVRKLFDLLCCEQISDEGWEYSVIVETLYLIDDQFC